MWAVPTGHVPKTKCNLLSVSSHRHSQSYQNSGLYDCHLALVLDGDACLTFGALAARNSVIGAHDDAQSSFDWWKRIVRISVRPSVGPFGISVPADVTKGSELHQQIIFPFFPNATLTMLPQYVRQYVLVIEQCLSKHETHRNTTINTYDMLVAS